MSTLQFENLSFDIRPLPSLRQVDVSVDAAQSPIMRHYLCCGETVLVKALHECPAIVGRIVAVVRNSTTAETPIHAHPALLVANPCATETHYIQIQWFMHPGDVQICDGDEWPTIVNDDDLMFTLGLSEVSETNCTIWVGISQIADVVFFVHLDECIEQVHGCVTGMSCTYFIKYSVTFVSAGSGTREILPRLEHKMYGSTTDRVETTCTEKCFRARMTEQSFIRALLASKSGLGGGTARERRYVGCYEQWYLYRLMHGLVFSERSDTYILHALRPDIKWNTRRVTCVKVSMKACSSAHHTILRFAFGINFGIVPVCSRWPSAKDMHITNLNPKRNCPGDNLHVVDADFNGIDEEDASGWLDEDLDPQYYFGTDNRNYIRWTYNKSTCVMSYVQCDITELSWMLWTFLC